MPLLLLLLLIRLGLSAVFLIAGLAKLADLAGSRQVLRDFGVPAVLANSFGVLLPLTELVVAVALVAPVSAWWGALGALTLLLLFVVGIAFNLARGRTPDCHCFGQLHSAPAGWPTLIRNLVLAAVVGVVIALGRSTPGPRLAGLAGGPDGDPTHRSAGWRAAPCRRLGDLSGHGATRPP